MSGFKNGGGRGGMVRERNYPLIYFFYLTAKGNEQFKVSSILFSWPQILQNYQHCVLQ